MSDDVLRRGRFLDLLNALASNDGRDPRSALRAHDAALRDRVEELEAERRELVKDVRRLLYGKPNEEGRWLHLLECSGDRRRPPGEPGHSCCCRVQLTDRARQALQEDDDAPST